MMRSAKCGLVAALAVALATHGLDCMGSATHEEAMQCCNTMRCHSPHNRHSHHSMDCCDATPQMHPALGQPTSVQAISSSPVTLGLVHCSSNSHLMEVSRGIIGAHSHDPPIFRGLLMSPLRI